VIAGPSMQCHDPVFESRAGMKQKQANYSH
jgi:hypothetical protein